MYPKVPTGKFFVLEFEMFQVADYLPQPTSWFSPTLQYNGIGCICFSKPKGWVKGETTVDVNHIGEMTVTIRIDKWCNDAATENLSPDDSRDWLLSGHKRDDSDNLPWRIYLTSQLNNNEIVSFQLQLNDKSVLSSNSIVGYDWDVYSNVIQLYLNTATYISEKRQKSGAKYWVLPCINLNFGMPFGRVWADRYKNLKRHPLRIFPVPEKTDAFLESDASKEDKAEVKGYLTAMSYIVGFFYNGEPAFIERLPHYDESIQKLADGDTRLSVTSLMVGEYKREEDESRPIDLLPVLGLATGRPVGAAWIEFRDENSDLVYRLHGNLGRYTYAHGRSVVNDIVHRGGVGQLLTDATQSQKLYDPLVGGALRNAARAISGEDRTTIFYYMFTALDELFTYYDIPQKIHPLQSYLTAAQKNDIVEILTQAQKDILKLVNNPTSPPNNKQIETIQRVANKARSQPLDKRTEFGDKLVALLNHFSFSDIDVLGSRYSDIDEWVKKVNSYRNTTMHATHYNNVHSAEERKNFEQITPHLLDILIRVLLKTLEYKGNYAPCMQHLNSSEELDWVKPTISPRELGYKP
jgi:hypothetical protein